MSARDVLNRIKSKFDGTILRMDVPEDNRLFLYIRKDKIRDLARYVFRDLNAR